jgi:hypothetical protein
MPESPSIIFLPVKAASQKTNNSYASTMLRKYDNNAH